MGTEKAKKKVEDSLSESETNKTTAPEQTDQVSIKKPSKFSLDKFKVKRTPTIGGIDPLVENFPIMKIADADDFVRLHPDEENYWSNPLCFVHVPIKGTKKENLHLIDEDLAVGYLPSKKIQRYRLALATKPGDVFFLCKVPSVNLDNDFNKTAIVRVNLERPAN
jgi:hypothetical protein